MRLRFPTGGPGVKRIVNDETVFQHLVIVRCDVPETHGDRQKSRRLRREVVAAGIGAAHDRRYRRDCWIPIEARAVVLFSARDGPVARLALPDLGAVEHGGRPTPRAGTKSSTLLALRGL